MPLEETGVREASYGPAGYIEAGSVFSKRDRKLLKETYKQLDNALKLLKAADYDLWISLHRPYLSDTADASVVSEWRRKAERGNEDAREAVELYDLAVRVLAILLHRVDLHVLWPKRMSVRDEKRLDRLNDEFVTLYRRLLGEGRKNREAVAVAASMCGLSESRGYAILQARREHSA